MASRIATNIPAAAAVLVLLLGPVSPAAAQLGGLLKGVTGGKTPAPPAPGAAPEGAVADLNEGTIEDYLEMRAFAEGLYRHLEVGGDALRASDFKRKVDTAFEASSKEDMQRAYQMNISAKSEVRYVIEDKFRVYTGLYDNPVVQSLANRVGQSIVSPKVSRLYTFKLVADPVPWAESLSTGTVWVSTGMVALMKTKAQLAYVLAHEAAHIYLQHHRQRLMLQFAQQEYNRQLEENGENRRKRWIWVTGAATAVGGAVVDVLTGGNGARGTVVGGLAGLALGDLLANATRPAALGAIEWNRFEEDEADRLAFDWLMDSMMDVEEVPKVYIALRDLGDRDSRVRLGFLGRTDRVRERLAAVQSRLDNEKAKPEWGKRRGQVTDPTFELLLAEVQRDNGVFAFHYDMLETARTNLASAAEIKKNDPTVLYFYARVLSQTARTDEERKEADRLFLSAAQNDYRSQNYGTYLHRAIAILTSLEATEMDKRQAQEFLKQYVIGYHLSSSDEQKAKGFNLPPHLEMVYDYLARAGEVAWRFDEDTIKRVQAAMDKGVPLVEYHDPGKKRSPSPGGVQRVQDGKAAAGAEGAKPKPKPTPTPVVDKTTMK